MRQIVKRSMTAFTVCMFMVFGFLSPASSAINYSVTQMTNNDTDDNGLQISNNGDMVWVGPGSGGYPEIYVYDEATRLTRKLTNNNTYDDSPQINARGDVVWRMYDTNESDYIIMLYIKSTNTVKRISLPKDPNFKHNDANPQINNLGQVVYQSQHLGTDNEIMFYDGAVPNPISVPVTTDSMNDEFPMLNDSGDIVWMKSAASSFIYDIYLRDGATKVITPITTTSVNEINPRFTVNGAVVYVGWNTSTNSFQIYYYKRSDPVNGATRVSAISGDNMFLDANAGGGLTWGGQVTASNMDVYFRNGLTGTPIDISTNSNDDTSPVINDNGWVAWYRDTGNTGTNDQIFVWDGTMINSTTPAPPTQFTTDLYDHINPVINNLNEIAWIATGGAGTTLLDYEVFRAITGPCTTQTCNDNNPCTTDSCNLATGTCVYAPIDCNDNSACTTDTCNPASGCVRTPIICNDNSNCTSDSCNPQTGCVYTPFVCNDFNACTTDTCDPVKGCIYTPLPGIDDHNACTTDTCNTATGVITHTPLDCNDNSACTTDTCNTTTGCVFTPLSGIDDGNACTIDYCNPATGVITHTPVVCNDYNSCSDDTCNTTTGQCVYTNNETRCPSTTGNDFTMLDPGNHVVGGTNDIVFSWDGTKKTSVAVSDQVSNALLTSACQYGGVLWSAHDLAVYGPGTYTVYTGCLPGSPGCGTGTPMTFTVKTGEIGIHMLFDWNANVNIDVVNIYMQNAVFAPSPMWTGGCGSNSACQVWGWMSYDWTGDGINGTRMVDGPFVDFSPNFNFIKGSVDPCCDSAVRCNDNDACTTDKCVPATGECTHTAVVCNDNNVCTTDTCNTATGCVYTNNTLSCSDNNSCTVGDVCSNGVCQPGAPRVCNDNNVCTTDVCVPILPFGCVYYANTLSCNDNNGCTLNDVCKNTVCTGTPKNCNDNDACTTDSCNTVSGNCTRVQACPSCTGKPDGTPCGDLNACTVGDTCLNGSCQPGAPLVCNDNNVCTTDTCSTSNGCVFTNNTGPCADNSSCTDGDYCLNGVCQSGVLRSCDDGNVCTNDAYVPIIAQCCVHWANTLPCNDNSACTSNDKCVNTVCTGTQKNCEDYNSCTTNGCEPVSGNCVYTPKPPDECSTSCVGKPNGADCTDNNACTNDSCVNQVCVSTTRTCNDNNVCTTDTCNTATGCVFTNNTAACSDNNYCTAGDVCSNGVCIPGATVNCDDGNICTTDASASFLPGCCTHAANTLACNDNNACTTGDVCSNKVCTGTAVSCTPPSTCNPATGTCQ